MKRFYLVLISFLVFGIAFTGCKNSSSNTQNDQKTAEVIPAFEVQNMDTTVNPGDDFFNYVNGNWIKNNPIPPDKEKYGAFIQLREKNKLDLKNIILEVSKKTDIQTGSNLQKVRDFYNSGMDSAKIEQLGLSQIQEFFDKVNNIKSIQDVQTVSAYLNIYGINPFFSIFTTNDAKNSEMNLAVIWQGGIGLPEKDYYFNTESQTIKIREAYLIHIAKMFELMGEKTEDAVKIAKTIMKIETNFAKNSFGNVENQDPQKTYNKIKISDLQNITPNFDWKNYLTTIGYSQISEINISQLPFIKEFNNILKSVSIDDWKLFLKWNIINALADYLPSKFVKQNFEFYSKTLNGQEQMSARWKKVIGEMDNNIGEIIGRLYVEKHFPAEAKQKMTVLVENLKKSMKLRISNLVWMSNETKKEALAILEKMNVKIGYPDKWRDYSGLEISNDSYLKNILNSRKFDFNYYMSMAGKKVDKTLWGMTPQTVNAYHSSSNNEIVFPAGILQPPLFNLNADDAVNYGAIGMVIGHEMTHGFDNTGRQYDKEGNLRDWWTKKDADEFNKRTQVLVKQYNKFEVLDSVFVNGEFTLGENISDLGGLTVAYYAYKIAMENKPQPKPIDGFNDIQRFFLSCAQMWRSSIRDKALITQVKTDEHSPAKCRINGTLFNMPEFYAAFPNIKKTDKLYITEENRPVIW